MTFDNSVRYRKTHEWAKKDNQEIVTGISDFAQDKLGDIVFVELPAVGKTFAQGEAYGTIESVKSANEIYLPMSGTITAVNERLKQSPELVNQAPFDEGWIARFKPSHPEEWEGLLDASAYEKSASEEG